MHDLQRAVLAPVMKSWVRCRGAELRGISRPPAVGQVSSEGLDADRILIVGAGLAVGWGAASHENALAGRLARALSDLTSRGADVDIQSSPTMTIDTVMESLRSLTLRRYDAIVLTLGDFEALDLVSERTWARKLSATLALLLAAVPPSTRVFLVGINSIRSVPIFDSRLGGIADAQAVALNAVSATICAALPRAVWMPLSPRGGTKGSRDLFSDYQRWAQELCDQMYDPLNVARAEGAAALAIIDRDVVERERQRDLDALGILDTTTEDRFDRIVALARSLYGTESAAFSIIDRDRQWHKSRENIAWEQIARVDSFCSIAIEDRGPFIVLDALADDRVSHSLMVTEDPHIRFYAGFPVESPSGERIGALCVFDPEPREADDVDPTMLRQLAHLIQAELRVKPTFD